MLSYSPAACVRQDNKRPPRVRFPVIGAPLFIISNPKLVIAQCQAGVVGAMPALNARPAAPLDAWLAESTEALARTPEGRGRAGRSG